MKIFLAIVQSFFILFVIAKLIHEYKCITKLKNGIYGSHAHENQHMGGVITGIVVEILELVITIIFFNRHDYTDLEVTTLFLLKSLVNIFILWVLLHFKQERLNNVRGFKLRELFKF